MALIVEDGTGRSDAESYASVDQYKTRCAKFGRDVTGQTDSAIEIKLRMATEYLTNVYRYRWKGSRYSQQQALDFPRIGVTLNDVDFWSGGNEGYGGFQGTFPADEVPVEVVNACIDLAFQATPGTPLMKNVAQQREFVQIGPIRVKNKNYGGSVNTHYASVAAMLSPFIHNNSVVKQLVR